MNGEDDKETLARVQAAVEAAIGQELLDIGEDYPLLERGVITSLDIVMITAALEEAFQIEIPDSSISMSNFHSLNSLAALVTARTSNMGEVGFSEKKANIILLSLGGALRRPVLFVLLLSAWFLGIDTVVGLSINGPLAPYLADFNENGMRLFPAVGGPHSIDDFQAAIRTHEISRAGDNDGFRVAFFGDSGTIGSYVRAREAIPAQAEIELKKKFKNAKCYNLAFYQTSFVKDAMILEAALKANGGKPPFDIAVITMNEFYFHPRHSRRIVEVMPVFGFNEPLFRSFIKRIGQEENGDYRRLLDSLSTTRDNNYWPLEPWFAQRLNLYKSGPRLRFLFKRHLLVHDMPLSDKFEYGMTTTGNRKLMEDNIIDPVPGYSSHDNYLSREDLNDNISYKLLEDIVSFLEGHGVRTLAYVKPLAPAPWKGKYDLGPYTSPDIVADIAQRHPLEMVDARFAIKGSQFTDSFQHYSAEGNRVIGRMIADKLSQMMSEEK